MDVMIIRRGLRPEFYFFLRITAKANGTVLVPDRRFTERRRLPLGVPAEHRLHERRGPPPTTWIQGDVIVLDQPTPSAEQPTGLLKKWKEWFGR